MTFNDLEKYLSKLDKELRKIKISEKAEIITEIKGHILEKIEENPNLSVNKILESFGEPPQIAKKYLNHDSVNNKKYKSILMVLLCLLGITPIIWWSTIHLSQISFITQKKNTIKKVKILFFGGSINLVNHSIKNKFKYKCQENLAVNESSNTRGEIILNFRQTSNCDCNLYLPQDVAVELSGINGQVFVNDLVNNLNIELVNGNVQLVNNNKNNYKYNLSVINGEIDSFKSSKKEKAYQINIGLINGIITRG